MVDMTARAALLLLVIAIGVSISAAQDTATAPQKANARPTPTPAVAAAKPDPFDKADVKTMAGQCVRFDTEAGVIEAECDGAAICYMLNQRSLDWLHEQLVDLTILTAP